MYATLLVKHERVGMSKETKFHFTSFERKEKQIGGKS